MLQPVLVPDTRAFAASPENLFHQIGKPGEDEFVRAQRDVSAMVDYFIGLVRANAQPKLEPDAS